MSGLVKAGTFSGKVAERIEQFDLGGESYLNGYPVSFWDVFGETGIPLRTTISEMGPLLLSRLLNLNATQEGLLNLVFRVADDRGLLLIDLKDLRAMLKFVAVNALHRRTSQILVYPDRRLPVIVQIIQTSTKARMRYTFLEN